MKEWKKPEVDELDVKETATGATEGSVEGKSGWINYYNSSIYEKENCNGEIWTEADASSGKCKIVPIKSGTES